VPRRISTLDGVRGLAALAVFTFHVWLYKADIAPSAPNFPHSSIFELRLGLIVFFVMSGFLLWRDVLSMDVRTYARRRAARILPAYYVAMVACWFIVEWARKTPGARPVDAGHVWLFAVFGQNYSPETLLKLNPVTWTLCIEVVFYVLLPLLAVALRPKNGVVAGLALIAAGVAWNWVVYKAGWGPIAQKALPAYLPYFGFGFIAAHLRERARGGTLFAICGLALIVGDAAWHASHKLPVLVQIFRDVPAGAGAALLILGAVGGATWLGVRPLAGLGLISYGFFLWQLPLILLLKRAGILPDTFVTAFPIAFATVLAVSSASWRFLEKPLLARARGTVAR
jgi:peptidoglycan/LPS O-acetylase OafA/YrhL